MSHSTILSRTIMPQRLAARRSLLGLGISLLVHVLAVAWLWQSGLSPRTEADSGPVRQMEVRLVTIAPKEPHPEPSPAPAPTAAVPRSTPLPASAAPRPPQSRRPANAAASSAGPAVTASPMHADAPADAPTDVPADAVDSANPATNAPALDLAAARATARLVARERGNGLLATESRKPVVDPNADRRVVSPLERARRVDCQTARAESTNLLGNVIMLAVDLAKNAVDDSGCKW